MDNGEGVAYRRVTVRDLRRMRRRGEPIVMVTAYDYPTASAADSAGIPAILVGDSLGTTILGYETTVEVTLDDMLHHSRAVARGARRAMVVTDLPFLTYQASTEMALRNAGRLLQEGGASAVKLEGGSTVASTVRRIVEAGIPVMGHIGLTPQSVHRFGGYRLQGRTSAEARRLLEDARALEAAGVFALVLEVVPGWLAQEITAALRIPTIGIGAGPACSGQIQVLADLVGLDPARTPRHARQYAPLGMDMRQAIAAYLEDVRAGHFPADENFTEGRRPAGFAEGRADSHGGSEGSPDHEEERDADE